MPIQLMKLAEIRGIVLEYWDFRPPLEGVYWSYPGIPPIIGISNAITTNRAKFRCVLAEELGHHFTTSGEAIPKTYFYYRDRIEVSRVEYKALRWAALYLMPLKKLLKYIKAGTIEVWELAEEFEVTKEMVQFRMNLTDIQNLNNQIVAESKQPYKIQQ